ncbi:Intraflagellar transport protein 80 homolog [Strongyloides ratti]|uniref:Intraflagellar transport protein 80 homolog n=1 Tax=Strongyloides ratti TaxID=34506 RepID=A0A090MZW0_STRRB|nr:Intraflagellar transport protein 80 homolog [Strongyloides ratti]CEF69620.1 Intraflagellar transport protein 80 homolog [Strongyloides ratti]
MKFEITYTKNPSHQAAVTAVTWIDSDDAITCGDDEQVLLWDTGAFESKQLMTLKGNFPTSIQLSNGISSTSNKKSIKDGIIISTTGGKIIIVRNNKIEKTINAHDGACLSVRWSDDGSSFVSCGEEGTIKMWSKNGMLRSVLARCDNSIYTMAWSPDSTKIFYCSSEYCYIKSLKIPSQPSKWKGHEGIITCCDWSITSNLIITGGEDCKYRVWDGLGRIIYTSLSHDYPITSLSWNPDGNLFVVGSYNLLRLCDKLGWSHSLEKFMVGSILAVDWSQDSTQIIAGTATGHVIYGQIIGKRLSWNNLEIFMFKNNGIEVKDVLSETMIEKLETKERIVYISVGFGYLVTVTTKQIYIYNSKNWNSPTIIDLKEERGNSVIQSSRFFLLIGLSILEIYGYEGRLQTTIKLQRQTLQKMISEKSIALSDDVVGVRDSDNHKIINLYDAINGKTIGDGKIIHQQDIIEICIDMVGNTLQRKIAFIDSNNDLYINLVNSFGLTDQRYKIASNAKQILFHDKSSMLLCLQENTKLLIFTYPNIVFVDGELLNESTIIIDLKGIGNSPSLINFTGENICVLKSNGAFITYSVSPSIQALFDCVNNSKWDQAVKVCRNVKEPYLWCMLAGMAVAERNVFIAEMAYSELEKADRVLFLSQIRKEKNLNLKNALFAMFAGRISEAETILLQSKYYFRAIFLNIQMYRWDRALQLALQYNMHIDTVLGYRQRYLEDIGVEETNEKILQQYSQVEVDWVHIKRSINNELAVEKEA